MSLDPPTCVSHWTRRKKLNIFFHPRSLSNTQHKIDGSNDKMNFFLIAFMKSCVSIVDNFECSLQLSTTQQSTQLLVSFGGFVFCWITHKICNSMTRMRTLRIFVTFLVIFRYRYCYIGIVIELFVRVLKGKETWRDCSEKKTTIFIVVDETEESADFSRREKFLPLKIKDPKL